jgi:electron transport complex protein RnfG
MTKSNSSITSMVITLFVITLVASTSLAYINELTKDRIAIVKLEKKLNAIREVVPEYDNNPQEEMFIVASDLDSLECYPAKKNGQLVGIAIESYTKKGFSGIFRLMIGFKPEGNIYSIKVIEHNETPGLGTEMKKPKFKDQYLDKNPLEFDLRVKDDGGDVDAITAATISSRAFSDAVQRAFDAWQKGGNK